MKEPPISDNEMAPAVLPAAAPPLTCLRCGLGVSGEAEYCDHCGAKVGKHKPVPWYDLHRRIYDWTLAWAYKPSAAVALFILSFAESSFFPIPPDVLLMPLALGNPRRWFYYAFLCTLGSVMGAVAGFCIGWLLWSASVTFLLMFIFTVLSVPPGLFLFRRRTDPGGRVLPFACALGAGVLLGWLVGMTAYQGTVSEFCFAVIPGFTHKTFNEVSELYQKYNFWIVFTAAFTPIPYKVITITAGIFGTGGQADSPLQFFVMFIIASIIGRASRFFLVSGLMRAFGPRIMPFIDRYFNWLALLFTALLIGGFVVLKYVM